MTDSSWDNGGYGTPARTGLPTWAKVLMGCGVAVLLLLATCVGGGVYLAHRIKGDPDFRNRMIGFAIDRMRPEWEDFRKVVEELRTPEGCRTLYAANPDLTATWPKESDFLQAATAWQPSLPPAPELTPDLLQHHGNIQINTHYGGKVRIRWRPEAGPAVTVTFDRPRRAGDTAPRRVLEVEVH